MRRRSEQTAEESTRRDAKDAKDANNKKPKKKMSHQKILPFLNKMESRATGVAAGFFFFSLLGGSAVMQAGVYGQSLPTAGNTRKRGPASAPELKRGHPLWEFPLLLV